MSLGLNLSHNGFSACALPSIELPDFELPAPASPVEPPVVQSQDSSIIPNQLLEHFLLLFPGTNKALAKSILENVYAVRSQLTDRQTQVIEGSDLFPHKIFVNQEFFQVIQGDVGQGAIGAISRGPIIRFNNSWDNDALFQNRTQTMVRKINHRPTPTGFSPVKWLIDRVRENVTPEQQRSIASYTHTSRLPTGHPTATMEYYPGTHFAFTEFQNATDLVNKFGMVANALSGYHANHVIHRDLKEANILNTPGFPVIIDPDGAKVSENSRGRMYGTPEYLNPSSFGPFQTSLVHQQQFMGVQRSCDDVYALSIIGLNCIRKHIERNVPQENQVVHQALNGLKPKYFLPSGGSRKFTTETLTAYGKKFGQRAFLWPQVGERPEKIGIYPSIKGYKQSLNTIFHHANLPANEVRLLKRLALLCVEFKHQSDNERYTAATIHHKCQEILHGIEDSPEADVSDLSGKKRVREDTVPTTKRRKEELILSVEI